MKFYVMKYRFIYKGKQGDNQFINKCVFSPLKKCTGNVIII